MENNGGLEERLEDDSWWQREGKAPVDQHDRGEDKESVGAPQGGGGDFEA